MATSTDGLAWTRREGAVLEPELEWEGSGLDRPRVARTADGYVMLYVGGALPNRGVAWSDDGVTWTRDGEAPAITAADFPITAQAWDAALVNRDGLLTYYLELGAGSTTTDIYRATATVP